MGGWDGRDVEEFGDKGGGEGRLERGERGGLLFR